MVCLKQLVLLAPTLRPTFWQQSVSTARRRHRRRNCWRVGWAVFFVALLTAVFDWNNVLAAHLRAKSRCQRCRSHSSLKQYCFNFECIRLFLFYSSASFSSPSFTSPSFSSPANSSPANSAIPIYRIVSYYSSFSTELGLFTAHVYSVLFFFIGCVPGRQTLLLSVDIRNQSSQYTAQGCKLQRFRQSLASLDSIRRYCTAKRKLSKLVTER